MAIELPKDAKGREIPLDTEALYNEDGKCFEVNRFTYSVVQTIPDLKWGVVFMDCSYDYCISFYLAPPEPSDSWEALEEDLKAVEDYGNSSHLDNPVCHYTNMVGKSCGKCEFYGGTSCTGKMCADILERIRKLRSDGR